MGRSLDMERRKLNKLWQTVSGKKYFTARRLIIY